VSGNREAGCQDYPSETFRQMQHVFRKIRQEPKSVNLAHFCIQKVESVMTAEGKAPFISLATPLYAISLMYGAGRKIREFAYRRRVLPSYRLPCKVICVGNITVGGTGKTPMTMHVAHEIEQLGYKAVIVSRGYRGRAESRGGIVSDGRSILMGPAEAGDEPYLIARSLPEIPVLVGQNRYAAGLRAVAEFQPDVIVLDDGFQHLKLQRDIDLVLLDHANPFGNSYLLPRGTLREPIAALARGTACIFTRHQVHSAEPSAATGNLIKKYTSPNRLFSASHDPYYYVINAGDQFARHAPAQRYTVQAAGGLSKVPIFGFSGIARNAEFQNTVKLFGFDAAGFLEFPDHHRYAARDLDGILTQAGDAGARRLITTEKDLARLAPQNPFPLELIVVGIKVAFGDHQQPFRAFLKQQLSL